MIDELLEKRVSIWSVPRVAQPIFYLAFSFQILIGYLLIRQEGTVGLVAIWTAMGPIVIFSATFALIAGETGGILMVLAAEIYRWRKRHLQSKVEEAAQKAQKDVTHEVIREIRESTRDNPEKLDEVLKRIDERVNN